MWQEWKTTNDKEFGQCAIKIMCIFNKTITEQIEYDKSSLHFEIKKLKWRDEYLS
jgi:hypothetical protein